LLKKRTFELHLGISLMKQINSSAELTQYLHQHALSLDKTLGFVPTMGALHLGHISLLNLANAQNDISIVSIFVNPTQFNNKSDLDKYPRNIEKDAKLLATHNCDVLFTPSVDEMYAADRDEWKHDFGALENTLEGEFRKGHFEGVGQIVYKLLNIVNPTNAYFGLKDYQQFLIIKSLVKEFNLSANIVGAEVIRDNSGLAMSSRNERLSNIEKLKASVLFKALNQTKLTIWNQSVEELVEQAKSLINKEQGVVAEYFEIRNAENLKKVNVLEKNKTYIALVAANVGNVRLIDNLILNE
jgi:pantoate--beta-alanine ligase